MASSVKPGDPVKLSQSWGVQFGDFLLNGKQVDFQDLMIKIAENRATTVEGEVAPLTTRIKMRNAELEKLGSLLAIFTKAQAAFKSNDGGGETTTISGIKPEQFDLLLEAYRKSGGKMDDPVTDAWANGKWTKSSIEGMVQAIKSMIDGRNNAAQTDMTRLQSLVDRRDESFSTATTLMTSISDTRSNLISGL